MRKGIILFAAVAVTALLYGQKAPSAKELVAQADADEKADRWDLACEKLRQAATQKPKDKNIAELLLNAETYLADKTAVAAIVLCDKGEIPACEKEIARAKAIKETARVEEARGRLAAARKNVQEQWTRVQQMIAEGHLNPAVAELESLNRFSSELPNLAAEKERLRGLRVEAALAQGRTETKSGNWDTAIESFEAAQRLDSTNTEAVKGIEAAKQEKEAGLLFRQAQNAFQSKGYEVAWDACQKAAKFFPARKPYQDLAKQIGLAWSSVLMEAARAKSANTENLKDNQGALDMLETIRRINPRQDGLMDELKTVRLTLNSLYVQKAGTYELVSDGSRAAITFAHYLNAQQTNQGTEFPFAAKLKEAKGLFDRKRSEQLVLSVENLSTASQQNADLLLKRARSLVGRLGLPDLKLRSVEEYNKSAEEDPLFKDIRPDGKSPTAILSVELSNYDAESTGDDKPIEKPSKFVCGQESIPNPDYADTRASYDKAKAELAKCKPGKACPGSAMTDVPFLEKQLASMPREIPKDKICDYTYQQYDLKRRAVVKMSLELRDMLEKQLISGDKIEVEDKRNGTEIAGVRDHDVNQFLNKQARLPSAEQLLQDNVRIALPQLDDKLNQLVIPYVQRFYAEGEKHMRDGRMEDAVESFLCHWYFFRGRLPEEQSATIRTLVKQELGLTLVPGTAVQ